MIQRFLIRTRHSELSPFHTMFAKAYRTAKTIENSYSFLIEPLVDDGVISGGVSRILPSQLQFLPDNKESYIAHHISAEVIDPIKKDMNHTYSHLEYMQRLYHSKFGYLGPALLEMKVSHHLPQYDIAIQRLEQFILRSGLPKTESTSHVYMWSQLAPIEAVILWLAEHEELLPIVLEIYRHIARYQQNHDGKLWLPDGITEGEVLRLVMLHAFAEILPLENELDTTLPWHWHRPLILEQLEYIVFEQDIPKNIVDVLAGMETVPAITKSVLRSTIDAVQRL